MKKDRNSLKRTKQPPVWRREPFPRVNGIMDALLRKVGFKTETYGAWFVKLSRKLELFEVEACIDLHRRAAPLQLAILNARQITSLDIEQEEKSAPPLTTQEARIAKVRSEQEQRLLTEKKMRQIKSRSLSRNSSVWQTIQQPESRKRMPRRTWPR